MRKAKVRIISVAAQCPYCESEDVFDPQSDSTYIDVNQYNKTQLFKCNDCEEIFQLEAKAWK